MYGKDLISNLKSELSGDFEDLILALMETPARYDAQQLRKAMQVSDFENFNFIISTYSHFYRIAKIVTSIKINDILEMK